MNTTKEIQTYSPISGLHVCANGTGSYVEKADYERLSKELADWQACAKNVDRKMLHEQADHNRTVDRLMEWKACAKELAKQLRFADASNSNSNYYGADDGRPASEQALKHFEELSG